MAAHCAQERKERRPTVPWKGRNSPLGPGKEGKDAHYAQKRKERLLRKVSQGCPGKEGKAARKGSPEKEGKAAQERKEKAEQEGKDRLQGKE